MKTIVVMMITAIMMTMIPIRIVFVIDIQQVLHELTLIFLRFYILTRTYIHTYLCLNIYLYLCLNVYVGSNMVVLCNNSIQINFIFIYCMPLDIYL